MLVGPTGGGKTTVRRILEKALVILPVAAILSVKEMQSDSKVNILLHKTVPICAQLTLQYPVLFFLHLYFNYLADLLLEVL